MKAKTAPPLPLYFRQRPRPGNFHAVEFGTHYTPRGPVFGACTGTILDIELRYLEPRIANVMARGGHEMLILHDGTIIDVATADGKPTRYKRLVKMTWPS